MRHGVFRSGSRPRRRGSTNVTKPVVEDTGQPGSFALDMATTSSVQRFIFQDEVLPQFNRPVKAFRVCGDSRSRDHPSSPAIIPHTAVFGVTSGKIPVGESSRRVVAYDQGIDRNGNFGLSAARGRRLETSEFPGCSPAQQGQCSGQCHITRALDDDLVQTQPRESFISSMVFHDQASRRNRTSWRQVFVARQPICRYLFTLNHRRCGDAYVHAGGAVGDV